MTSDGLRDWQQYLRLTDRVAARVLGIKPDRYAALLAARGSIDRTTALACAALAAGLRPWGSSDGLDGSQPLKPRPEPQHLLPVHD